MISTFTPTFYRRLQPDSLQRSEGSLTDAEMSTPNPALLHGLLDEACRRWPNRVAVLDESGADTYRELTARSIRAAAWLRRHGVRRKDRVLLHVPGGRDFAALLYATSRLGAIAVPAHHRTDPARLRWIINDATPVVAVTAGDPANVPVRSGMRVLACTLPNGDDQPLPSPGAETPRADEPALFIYTSGSTGHPRAVVCPHERISYVVRAIADRLRYTADDTVLCAVPVSFDYGLYQLLLAATAGARVAWPPAVDGLGLLRSARSVEASVLPVVPSLAVTVLRIANRSMPRWRWRPRLLTSTGAALHPALAGELRIALPYTELAPMYGMTECKRISIGDSSDAEAGSVGRPLDGTHVSVVDREGRRVGPGLVGEIRVSGPHVMQGYWNVTSVTGSSPRFVRPDAADRALCTGDYGWLDRNGRLFLAGRRDDIFSHRGIRTSGPEIEAAVLNLPGVEEAAVIAPRDGEPLTVWVVGDLKPTRVLKDLAQAVHPLPAPDRCIVLDRIPRTPHGKLDRNALTTRSDGRKGQWPTGQMSST
jgi:acyl-CoA synthetase (AMP-forming)/AMP-acid ligase II